MAHELEIIDGRASFLGRDDAWHRLGHAIGRPFTWADVVEYCPTVALPVNKLPLGDLMPLNVVPADMHGMLRSDGKLLAVVGDKYEPVQAEEMYDFGNAVQGLTNAPLVSVAGLREGRQYAFTYHLGDSEVGGEQFTHKFSIVGSHDGSILNMGLRSTTTIVCANTMAAALMSAVDRITLRHTANVRERMEEAVRAAQVSREGIEHFEQTVAALQTTPIGTRDFDLLLDGVFPVTDAKARTANEVQRARGAVRSLFGSPLTEGFGGTGWAFVQAVNTYEQWSAPVRKTKGVSTETVRALRQFDALVKGGHPLTQKAASLVLAGV
jgi:phage/plasmid-like protein (TIGR03299 family)